MPELTDKQKFNLVKYVSRKMRVEGLEPKISPLDEKDKELIAWIFENPISKTHTQIETFINTEETNEKIQAIADIRANADKLEGELP